MAQPNPIFTSLSTTVVQIDTLPATVILNTVSYPGQLVTVLNTLSTLDVLTNPIVVSTIGGTVFLNNNVSTFSTLIQQPEGYITAQTRLPNQWNYLNSYPFRDQYISAGVQTLTTSTLVTALTSTIVDITSSIKVENLIVSGNFIQDAGLILNTSLSTLGYVYLFSSLTVLGNAYFSSSVSSIGYTVFGSTLSVGLDLTTQSSLRMLSNLYISTSLSVLGDITTISAQNPITLGEGLILNSTLQLQWSSPLAMNIAGSIFLQNSLSTFSSVNVGGALVTKTLDISGNLSTLSSIAMNENIFVDNQSILEKDLAVHGKLGLANSLSVGESMFIQNNLHIKGNLHIHDKLYTLSSLSTNYLGVEQGTIEGNLTVVSSPGVSTQSIDINGSLGFQKLFGVSTTIGGSLSTTSQFVPLNGTFLQGYFTTVDTISTISSFSTLQDMNVLGSMSIGKGLAVSGGIIVKGSANVKNNLYLNTALQQPLLSTAFNKDLSVVGSLYITDTAILSSITLPSSLLAFNFITSTMRAENQGIANDVQISSLFTSSITTGGILQTDYTMDMANTFLTQNLSTYVLSTLFLQVGASVQPSTFFETISSFGVLTYPSTGTFDVRPIAYTMSTTYVYKLISTLQINASTLQGSFFGDGFYLSNVNYPERISTLILSTTAVAVEKTFFSTLLASSGTVVDSFFPYSTLRVGAFSIYGNAKQDIQTQTNRLVTVQNSPNSLILNNMYVYGNATSFFTKQVVINSNVLPSLSNIYTLGVGGILRLNEILSPEFTIFIDTFYGDIVVGVNAGFFANNTMYISSGMIGKDGGTFFIGEQIQPLSFSTNCIQPIQSTLAFNSTLFANRETKRVGINTTPFYTLDVYPEAYTQQGIYVPQSTLIQNSLQVKQALCNYWLAVASNTEFSNILYSEDEGENWDYFTPTNLFEGGTLLNVAYNGGQLQTTTSNTLTSKKRWIATGVPFLQYYDEGTSIWNLASNTNTKFPESNCGIAYNGLLWVLTGVNTLNISPSISAPVQWSEDGITWVAPYEGGFLYDGVSQNYGGRAVAWNGTLWVTVGKGDSVANSILYSGNGKNWSNAQSGGFANGGFGVTWTGSNWVATGDSGNAVSSFCVSTDGKNWLSIDGYGFSQRGTSIASDGRLVVATGITTSGNPPSIQYSTDGGYTWNNGLGSLLGDNAFSVVWNGKVWLAGGSNGIRKSLDGITWSQPAGSLTTGTFCGLAYSSNAQPYLQIGASNYVSTFVSTFSTFSVACGVDITTIDSNCLRYSEDGINWCNAVSGYFREEGRAAAYNNAGLWVAAGKGTASNFIYSADGKNWSDVTFVDVPAGTAGGTSVAYGNGYWIGLLDAGGGGGNLIYYSTDGSNWRAVNGTQFTSAGLGVATDTNVFVAVGYGGNTILYTNTSPPTTWSATNITNAFDTKGHGVAYGNGVWIACGEDSGGYTIKYSGDYSNWSNSTTPFATAGYGVDYNGTNRWVAVGDGAGAPATSNILYSDDNGVSWNNITSGDFISKGLGVRYNPGLGLWLAAGEDPGPNNTLKYSGDGLNWSNATGAFDTRGYGFGVYSLAISTQTTAINQLRIYNTPGPNVTTRDTTPTISYTSTSLTLLDTLTIDRFKTVGIQQYPMNRYVSTFYDSGLALISTVVSTQATQVAGYFLTSALV